MHCQGGVASKFVGAQVPQSALIPPESVSPAPKAVLAQEELTKHPSSPPQGQAFLPARVSGPTCAGSCSFPIWHPRQGSQTPELARKAGFAFKGGACIRLGLPCPAPAWVASAHVAPAQGSRLCSCRALTSATRCSQSIAKAGGQLLWVRRE